MPSLTTGRTHTNQRLVAVCLCACVGQVEENLAEESVQPSGRILQSRAESQRIAAWELLYRVQHPGRYVSRLQTILHPDIAVNDPRHGDDQHNTYHRCEGSWFPTPNESGLAAVNEDQIHGPNNNCLP